MKKCKQALNDNTCDKDCWCYYCEDFETCGHACSNFDDKEELEQQGCEEQFDEETALQEFNKDSNALAHQHVIKTRLFLTDSVNPFL